MPTIEDLTASQITRQRTLDYTRYLALSYQNDHTYSSGAEVFAARYPRSPNIELIRKAAVPAGGTSDATWAQPLVRGEPLGDAWIEYLRPLTIVGRLPLRTVPFGVNVPTQTGAGVYNWVSEGAPKPVTKLAYGSSRLDVRKVAGIITVTTELMRLSVPNAEVLIRDEIANGLAALIDVTFVDQSLAPSATSPGGITNGVTPIATSGAALATDVSKLIGQFWTNNPGATRARLIMGPNHASQLIDATKTQTLTTDGGTVSGIPVVISGNVGNRIIALDAAQVLVGDDGLDIDLSRQALIQSNDAPDNPATAATPFVSLWQANLIGLRANG